jgi:hypothetical protein
VMMGHVPVIICHGILSTAKLNALARFWTS